jgi:hypothetical protein
LANILGRLQTIPAAEAVVRLGAAVDDCRPGRRVDGGPQPDRDRAARHSRRRDERDKEINRLGEYASRWFAVGGAAAGFVLALAKAASSPRTSSIAFTGRQERLPELIVDPHCGADPESASHHADKGLDAGPSRSSEPEPAGEV